MTDRDKIVLKLMSEFRMWERDAEAAVALCFTEAARVLREAVMEKRKISKKDHDEGYYRTACVGEMEALAFEEAADALTAIAKGEK